MIDFNSRPAPATGHMIDYDRNSTVQDKLVHTRADKVADLVRRIGPLDGEFRIGDYGCGPGHSALAAVMPAIAAYRAFCPDGPVVVRHNDQAGNDWNGLLALVSGPDGYSHVPGVRTEIAAGSFYEPLATPGSIALATSFAASHWLSRAVHPFSPGAVGFDALEGAAREEMRALALDDWTHFLRLRAAELMAGGYLMVGTFGSIPDPASRSGIRAGGGQFLRAFEQVAETMADDGLIDRQALDRFVLPFWFLTVEEATAPVAAEPDLAAALEVVEARVEAVPARRNEIYSAEFDDPADYGRRAAGYVRAFSESSMRLHLFAGTDDEAQVDARIDEFFRRLAAYIPNAPVRAELLNALFIYRRRPDARPRAAFR